MSCSILDHQEAEGNIHKELGVITRKGGQGGFVCQGTGENLSSLVSFQSEWFYNFMCGMEY